MGDGFTKLLLIFIQAVNLVSTLDVTAGPACRPIIAEAREACPAESRQDCIRQGCCWDQAASTDQCYHTGCRSGYFGWRCQYRCDCIGGLCNPDTGECKICRSKKWGPGCLLESGCTYNDPAGKKYEGKLSTTEENKTCKYWLSQRRYNSRSFPTNSLTANSNYCRNPKEYTTRPWCYTDETDWGWCELTQCECPLGRYGTNCPRECHCNDVEEKCDIETGRCRSGCHPHFTGPACQDCADGRFSTFCEKLCHCRGVSNVCDKTSGECDDGCAAGWQGPSCQRACDDGLFGDSCSLECHCLDNQPCDKVTGHCPAGCARGFVGPACQTALPKLSQAPELVKRNSDSITIRFDNVTSPGGSGRAPISAYYVSFKPAHAKIWTTKLIKSTNVFTARKLSFGSKYEFQVAPYHQTGVVGSASPSLFVYTCSAPSEGPTNIVLTRLSKTEQDRRDYISLRVEWQMPPNNTWNCDGIHQYHVCYHKSSELTFNECKTTSKTYMKINNVNRYEDFTVGVTAINNAFRESERTLAEYKGECGPVPNIVAVPGNLYVHLRWERALAPEGAIVSYNLRWMQLEVADCTDTDTRWTKPVTLPPDTLTYKMDKLNLYAKYKLELWAVCDSGKGTIETREVTTEATEPVGKVQALKQEKLSSQNASFRWNPPPCDKRGGRFRGYFYNVLRSGQSFKKAAVNTSKVLIQGLHPATRYLLLVRYINHVGKASVKAALWFTTKEDRPTAPKNLQTDRKTATSLTVSWKEPDPTNGQLTGYNMEAWNSQNINEPLLYSVSPEVTQHMFSRLQTNTTYGIRVQAVTRVGPGPWSAPLYAFIEEGVPEAPSSFQNTSRNVTKISFTWNPPLITNGILISYLLSCRMFGASVDDTVSRKVPATVRTATLIGLQPGSLYICELRGGTSKGNGEAYELSVYTLPQKPSAPPAPTIELKESTDTSVTIVITGRTFRDAIPPKSENTNGMYQIVVEHMKPQGQEGKVKVKRSPDPCQSPLYDYNMAREEHSRCYITAELLPGELDDTFTVGDGHMYGNYYNAPLEKGHKYNLWFGHVIQVDGVTAAAYTKSEVSITAEKYTAVASSREGGNMVAAGIGMTAVVVVLILVMAVGLFILIRRRRSQKPGIENTKNPEDLIMDTQLAPGRVDGEGSVGTPDMEPTETDPLYTNMEASAPPGHPIHVEALWNYVKDKKKNTCEGFKGEFEEIPHGLNHPTDVARRPENKTRNRYGNIIAYDHSRVTLEIGENDSGSDYVNANYLSAYKRPKAYVATQGPNKTTICDMWRMVWQLNSHRIVMVTNLIEDGRHKCELYWPNSASKLYGDILVEYLKIEQLADFTIRNFKLTKGREERIVHQFHFTAWPDHGIPSYTMSFLAFRKKVRSYDDPESGPTIIHCSAGVGRTGTFIALDYLLDQAKVERQVDVFSCVCGMRENRVNMVQTLEQYVFVYEALLEALKCGDTSIPCVDFRIRYLGLCRINTDTGKLRLLEEYELLGAMSTEVKEGCRDSQLPDNMTRNRHQEITPMNNLSRPYLVTYFPGATDYINAVYVDGYKHKDALIITQMPLPNTVTDFWALVHDHEIRTVIMLNDLDLSDPTCAQYWPDSLGRYQYGPFDITLMSEDDSIPELVIRDFTLNSSKKDNEPQMVRQFQYAGWQRGEKVPGNSKTLISLLSHVEKWQQRSGNQGIVVHCMNGAERSGLYCAVSYMIERMKLEQDVDIFQTVKHVRMNRPQMIVDMDQYKYLYDMAMEYMDCFETYANFK